MLWLFGGIFGAHHLYLGNDLQAFIWLTTLGSYIGIRWISEGFLIPQMVREANEDPSYMSEIEKMMRTTKKPPFSLSQFLFAILVGFLWSKLFMTAIPQDKFGGIDWSYLHWLTPFVGSLGTIKLQYYVWICSFHLNFILSKVFILSEILAERKVYFGIAY